MKHVKIVSYDWLEDSLMSKTRRPKRETQYLWEKLLKKKTQKKAAKAGKIGKSTKGRNGGAGIYPSTSRIKIDILTVI